MQHKTAGIAATALAAAAALTVGVNAASATTARQTQSFQAQATGQTATGSTGFILADQDVRGTTVIGHDVLSCTVDSTGPSCDVAFAQADGILDAHLQISDATGAVSGVVRGGSGRYRHAHGTLSGTTLSRSAVQITLHYWL